MDSTASTTLRVTPTTLREGRCLDPAGGAAPAVLPPRAVPEPAFFSPPFEPSWAKSLHKWRWALIGGYLLIQLLAFNGQWRMGLDSALYRHVGHSLATGQGYTIFGEPQRLIYPGLPMMLGGLERLFGPAAWPAILVLQGMALATIWLTWRLMSRVTVPWIALAVTAGVAYNATFVRLSHELLTDVPFLLGVVMTLWGWETMRDPGFWRRAGSAGWILLGLALCASMRPTFWVLAAALGLVCVGGVVTGIVRQARVGAAGEWVRSWRSYAFCLVAVAVVGVLFLLVDPRTSAMSPFQGGYEAELVQRMMSLEAVAAGLPGRAMKLLHNHLVGLFFAERVVGLNFILSIALLCSVALISRRRPLWAMIVALLLAAILATDSEPRYWLMVLPILWLSWIWMGLWICARLPGPHQRRSLLAAAMIAIPIGCYIGHHVKLILEQRSQPFVEGYRHGVYAPIMQAAEVISREIPPGQTVIGPYSTILSYSSGRRVVEARQLFGAERLTLAERARRLEASGADYAVFPSRLYQLHSRHLYELAVAEIFVPINQDDTQIISIGWYDGWHWYLAQWAIEEAMIPPEQAAEPPEEASGP